MKRLFKAIMALTALLALYLTLWPIPIDPIAWNAPEDTGLTTPFMVNEQLQVAEIIGLAGNTGPEDVTIGFGGHLYSGTEGGKVVSFQADGSDLKVFADVGGRPLGLDFSGSFLYVANAELGLQRIRADGRVIPVVTAVDGQAIVYANDVAVAKDGSVYFTDASTKFSPADWGGTYAASLLDVMEHGGHGRVYRYDAYSGQTTLLMDGLNFANGIAISDDQQYLLIAETGSYRLWRYTLTGSEAGSSEVIIDNLPGFPDNINSGLQGRFWVGLVSPRSALLDQVSDRPFMRKMIQRLPSFLRPAAVPSSHLIAIDSSGVVLMDLQDPNADFPAITGAIETRQFIYVSSLFSHGFARIAKNKLN